MSLAEPPEQPEPSDELAWRVHDNAKDWIAQVDVKATAALAIEAAILGFLLAFVANTDTFKNLTVFSRWTVGTSFALLMTSVTLSTLVLLPRIKLREPPKGDEGYLYFGHLRHWEKLRLSRTLARNRVDEGEIADQVIKMSEIAWRKHVLLRWSLIFLLAGLLVTSALSLTLILGLFPGLFEAPPPQGP